MPLQLTLASSFLVVNALPLSSQEQKRVVDKTDLLIDRLVQYHDHYERDASRITLLQAIKTGLEQNPALAKSYLQIQQAQWQAIAVQREWIPTLLADSERPGVAGYSDDRYESTVITSKDSFSQTQNRYQRTISYPRIQLQWTFFDPIRSPRLRSNLAALRADELLFDVTARDLVLEIQQNYYTLQKYYALESDYRHLFSVAKQATALADQKRRAAGEQLSDVAQLKSFEYSLLTRRINIHEEVLKTAAQLALSLSLKPGDLVMPADPLELHGSWMLPLESTIQQALSLREEIKKSLATAERFSWEARASNNITLPTFYLQYRAEIAYGRYSSLDEMPGTSSLSAGRERKFYDDAGLYFTWPLFDGGTSAASPNSLRRISMQAEKQAELDRLTVASQVQISHASYVSSQIVVDSAADELRVLQKALKQARDDFAQGRANATTLVQILEGVRKATDDYRSSVSKHNIAVAELYHYSASWPDTALPILQKRVQQLRQ